MLCSFPRNLLELPLLLSERTTWNVEPRRHHCSFTIVNVLHFIEIVELNKTLSVDFNIADYCQIVTAAEEEGLGLFLV